MNYDQIRKTAYRKITIGEDVNYWRTILKNMDDPITHRAKESAKGILEEAEMPKFLSVFNDYMNRQFTESQAIDAALREIILNMSK